MKSTGSAHRFVVLLKRHALKTLHMQIIDVQESETRTEMCGGILRYGRVFGVGYCVEIRRSRYKSS